MLLKRNKFERREQEQKEQKEQTQSDSESSELHEQKEESVESEQNKIPTEERQVNLRNEKSKKQYSNLGEVLNLYYDNVNELERELSHFKRERKNMKITYINEYLNRGSKLSPEENSKRQELKKKLLTNGDKIFEIKEKLHRILANIIENLNSVKIE